MSIEFTDINDAPTPALPCRVAKSEATSMVYLIDEVMQQTMPLSPNDARHLASLLIAAADEQEAR